MIEPFETIAAILRIFRDFFVRYFLPLHGDADLEPSADPDEPETASPPGETE